MIVVKSKKEVADLLKEDIPQLGKCVRGAWDAYQSIYSAEQRSRHSSISRAALVHDEMVRQAEEMFEGRKDVRHQRIQKMFVLQFGANVVVRFKKFDDSYCVSSIPTKQSLSFMNQQFELPGYTRPTTLHAGYRLNKLETALEGTYLVCPRGYGHEWILDLDNLDDAADNVVLFPKLPPLAPQGGFRLKLVPKDKEVGDDK